jgi:ATP-dependent protease ClpP protease subunit
MARKQPLRSSTRKSISDVEFFKSLPDDAFFCSDTVQHVYMYGMVNDKSLAMLRNDIVEACKSTVDAHGNTMSPRPIVLHVNSPGGESDAGLSMMSVFGECRVPICACVDGISYSAGTLISILAPYRVMAPMATSLVHQYSMCATGKSADMQMSMDVG